MTNPEEHPEQETLMAWRDDELGAEEAGAVRAHIAKCVACRELVGAVGAVSERLAAWQVEPARFEPLGPRMTRRATRWVVAASAAVLLLAGWAWWSGSPGDQVPPPQNVGQALAGGRPGLPAAAPARGPEAPLTVIVFVDWQCPPCLDAYTDYQRVVGEFNVSEPGRVSLAFKDFPLDASCNPAVSRTLHPAACTAAAAVRMARERHREAELIEWLAGALPEQRLPEDVRQATTRILGPIDFDGELARQREAIARDIADGRDLHVQATPAVFVNGVAVRPGESVGGDDVRAAIAAALERTER